ncbi:perforin 1.5 [Megalops cyprinoides]|uniref:perforin 1.5 n=1 Tax=Megalops cyprinoides TaxID=118141 RepID=UPI00186413F5|nr:perforin 1.5 [Megalops cyprinoides]
MGAMASERHRELFLFTLILPFLAHLNRCMACRLGLLSECEKAPFVPGYNLAGEGFDVVRMHRKGAYVINVKAYMKHNDTCTICENRFLGGQMQKLPANVLDWRPFSRCKKQLSSALHHSVDSLLRSSTSLINNNWGVDLNLDDLGRVILGGSRSEIAQFARSQFSLDKATFATHELSCTHYSYRLADHPTLSTEFSKHLLRLPRNYDVSTKPLYRRLIDTYGTHYIRQVQLGGRVRRVTAFRTCLATLKGFSEYEIKNCLDIELKMALGFLPVNASLTQKCSHILTDNMTMGFYQGFMTHKMEVLGGEKYFPDVLFNQDPSSAYSSWMSSLNVNPDVVSYAVFPLHHLVGDPEVGANLRRAVLEYIEENRLEMALGKARTCSPAPNLDHNCCPLRAGRGCLRITVEKASGLKADVFTESDGFVKVWYNERYEETDVIKDDNNPVWNDIYNFGSVELGHELTFEVWDRDLLFNDLLGQCKIYPERGIHSHSCELYRGVFYFTYSITCDMHLTGYRCERYSPDDTESLFNTLP